MTVLLLNPNTNAATTAAMVAIAAASGTGLSFVGRTAPFGAPMIVDGAALVVGAEAVDAMAAAIGNEGAPVAGLVVSAFGDPGIDRVRRRLAIPVTGIGEASMLEAADGGRRFAVATTTPGLTGAIAAKAASLGLADLFAGTVLTDGDPVALVRDPAALESALAAAAEQAARAGADVVIIGGGPLAAAAAALRARLAIAIVEPVPAAARRIRGLIDGSARPLP